MNNDMGLSFTGTENSSRSGAKATVPHVPRNVPARVVSLYEQSFTVKAPNFHLSYGTVSLNMSSTLEPEQQLKVHLEIS